MREFIKRISFYGRSRPKQIRIFNWNEWTFIGWLTSYYEWCLKDLPKIATIALVYVITAKFGLMYAVVAGMVTLTWLPSGIAMAAVVKFGNGMWSGVALGALLANLSVGASLPTATSIAAGNTLEALVGAFVFRRLVLFHKPFFQVRDVFALVFAAAASAVLAAVIGAGSLVLGKFVTADEIFWTWLMWWMGDTTGILIATPALLVWADPPYFSTSPLRVIEAFLLLATLLLGVWFVFAHLEYAKRSDFPDAFAIFPIAIWGALRFGVRGSSSVTLIIALLTIFTTTHGTGPFVVGTPLQSQVLWWIFSTLICVTGLLLGAVSQERKSAEAELQRARDELEHRVDIRTRELIEINRCLHNEIGIRKRLEKEVIEIGERQRQQIGQDLHDGLGQVLTGVAFLSQALAEQIRAKIPELSPSIGEIVRLINEAISTARSVARGYYPDVPDGGDLAALLEQMSHQAQQRFGIECLFRSKLTLPAIDHGSMTNLYCIAQEAVNNAVRHGKAKRILMELETYEREWWLRITDDGVGFKPRQQERAEGLGLQIMRHRANRIGASLDIRQVPEGGMEVLVHGCH